MQGTRRLTVCRPVHSGLTLQSAAIMQDTDTTSQDTFTGTLQHMMMMMMMMIMMMIMTMTVQSAALMQDTSHNQHMTERGWHTRPTCECKLDRKVHKEQRWIHPRTEMVIPQRTVHCLQFHLVLFHLLDITPGGWWRWCVDGRASNEGS